MVLPDRDSLASYGGPLSNYSDPVDPTTDEDAAWRNKYAANVAMMTHMIPRAFRAFLGTTGGATGSTPFEPSSGAVHDAVWGDSAAVKPTLTHVSTGTYDVIWPSTVTDELSETHVLSIRRAIATVEPSSPGFRDARATVTAAQKVRVYTYSGTSVNELAGELITVWIY